MRTPIPDATLRSELSERRSRSPVSRGLSVGYGRPLRNGTYSGSTIVKTVCSGVLVQLI